MKIILAQKHDFILNEIHASIARKNLELAKSIIYTTDPHRVLKEVLDERPVFIVSGQQFNPTLTAVVETYSLNGLDLGWQVKAINKHALFYIYTYLHVPLDQPGIDGVICKIYPHQFLVKILTSDLDGSTGDSIKKKFPECLLG